MGQVGAGSENLGFGHVTRVGFIVAVLTPPSSK